MTLLVPRATVATASSTPPSPLVVGLLDGALAVMVSIGM
jgi:hypothetical protein